MPERLTSDLQYDGLQSGKTGPILERPRPRHRPCRWWIVLLLGLLPGWALAGCNPAPPAGPQSGETPGPSDTTTPAATHTVHIPLLQANVLPSPTPTLQPSATPEPTATPEPGIRFAVIGDYGSGNADAAAVADLITSWEPDFILTTGDNNYPSGSAATIDAHIGQFYHGFIHPYVGSYGQGADINRFFPTLGNHDWDTAGAQPYLDYFTLPGNERYYDFEWGPVHFFALDSDWREPDGVSSSSIQAAWLQGRLAAATAPWRVVYTHLPAYSSGLHGSIDWIQWPFSEWGATIFLAGHDHTYERLEVDGFPYIVNGLGGGGRYTFGEPLPGSLVRFNSEYGAMLGEATSGELTFQFITVTGAVIDNFSLSATARTAPIQAEPLTAAP